MGCGSNGSMVLWRRGEHDSEPEILGFGISGDQELQDTTALVVQREGTNLWGQRGSRVGELNHVFAGSHFQHFVYPNSIFQHHANEHFELHITTILTVSLRPMIFNLWVLVP